MDSPLSATGSGPRRGAHVMCPYSRAPIASAFRISRTFGLYGAACLSKSSQEYLDTLPRGSI